MDVSIGAKGGANDRRRTRIIKENKEAKEIKELERELKKKRPYILIKTIPLVIGGTALRALKEEKKEKTKEFNPTKKKINIKENIEVKEEPKEFEDYPYPIQEKIEKLKTRKIVEEYETKLKDVRYELRNKLYEQEVLKEEEQVEPNPKTEQVFEKISTLIDKVGDLKETIEIENLEKYDDNYIYVLIESYLEDFKNRKENKEIKDSPLYIELSKKIEVIENKKETIEQEVQQKKEVIEEDFEELKEKFNHLNTFREDFKIYLQEQEKYEKELEEKVRNATTVKERVETQIKGMNRQSKRMLRLLTFQMLFPGNKTAKQIAAATTAYLAFMKKVVDPTRETKTIQEVHVVDYSNEIIRNIEEITLSIKELNHTKDEIKELMIHIKDQMKEYPSYFKEYDELMNQLNRIKQDIEEKEYEMEKMKKEQEYILENNNAKVKKRGEYPVN